MSAEEVLKEQRENELELAALAYLVSQKERP